MPVVINGTTGISGVDGTAASPAIEGGDTDTGLFFPVAGATAISTNGVERMRINSSGNVGIGTASPTVPLDIRGNSTGRISQYIVNASTTANSASELVLYTDNAAEYIGLVGFTNAAGYLSFNNPAGGVVGVVPAQPLQFRTTDIERLRIAADGQLSAVVAGGSALYPAYTARAWVNFNGTGTVAIRASGNVTSITDLGTGKYRLNFTTAMPDVNFAIAGFAVYTTNTSVAMLLSYGNDFAPTTSSVQVGTANSTGATVVDASYVNVVVFR